MVESQPGVFGRVDADAGDEGRICRERLLQTRDEDAVLLGEIRPVR